MSIILGDKKTIYKVGGANCSIYLGSIKMYPSFEGKYQLTLSDSTTVSAACDGTSAITQDEISAYTSTTVAVEIGECVTSIGTNAFRNFSGITSVEIPDSVTSIGANAFRSCTNLASISLPSSVTSIDGGAFRSCTNLASVAIPSSVSGISYEVFSDCVSLTSVTIPSSVTRIDNNAFKRCSGLTSVVIPSGVTRIAFEAFNYCSGLTSITVNATTPPALEQNVFNNTNDCPIYVPAESVETYKAASGWSTYASRIQAIPNSFVATYSTGATYSELCGSYSTLTSATTKPSGYDYTDMVSAEVGICIDNIDATAFNGMSSLSGITFDSTTPPTIASGAFDNTQAMLYVPCSSVGAYRAASNWSSYTDRIVGYESCTTYDWEVVSGEYICQTGDKYEKEKKIRSFDGGTTWEDVIPNVYQAGQLIESGSTDCQHKQYEYIRTENSSESYYKFDTGFYPTTANTIEVKVEFVDTSVDWGVIIGWSSCDGDDCDSTQFRVSTVTGGYGLIARKGNTNGIMFYVVGANMPITVTLPLSASAYTYYDGELTYTCDYNIGSFSLPSSTPLNIFSLGYDKPAAVAKIYYVKVYDANNNLVKHYIPSDDNGTPCFYEVVDGDEVLDTYTGANHGTLTLGPVVN